LASRENILLPDPGIDPLAPPKKYFRDRASHAPRFPISGIFVTDRRNSIAPDRPLRMSHGRPFRIMASRAPRR
jgi:hypothetical protein